MIHTRGTDRMNATEFVCLISFHCTRLLGGFHNALQFPSSPDKKGLNTGGYHLRMVSAPDELRS